MKRHLTTLNLLSRKADSRHLQIVLALVSLGLFVLGAGAPAAVGIGGNSVGIGGI